MNIHIPYHSTLISWGEPWKHKPWLSFQWLHPYLATKHNCAQDSIYMWCQDALVGVLQHNYPKECIHPGQITQIVSGHMVSVPPCVGPKAIPARCSCELSSGLDHGQCSTWCPVLIQEKNTWSQSIRLCHQSLGLQLETPLPQIVQPCLARNFSRHARFCAFSAECWLDNISPMPLVVGGRLGDHLFKGFIVAIATVMLSEADGGILPIEEAPGNQCSINVSSSQSHFLLFES